MVPRATGPVGCQVVMFIYDGVLVQLLRVAGAKPYLLRALQTAFPGLHQRFPYVVLAVEVRVSYAYECARQMCLDLSANVACGQGRRLTAWPKLTKEYPRITPTRSNSMTAGKKYCASKDTGTKSIPS